MERQQTDQPEQLQGQVLTTALCIVKPIISAAADLKAV